MSHSERWAHPLVRVERRPTGDGRAGPVAVEWDAWDGDGRRYLLTYRGNCGRVRLDDGRLLTEFWVDGSYQAVTGLEEFLRLAGLRFGPGAP